LKQIFNGIIKKKKDDLGDDIELIKTDDFFRVLSERNIIKEPKSHENLKNYLLYLPNGQNLLFQRLLKVITIL
jgi:hypothetical protein